jgi:uncharacterized RDD family membrane protein YckC
VSYPSRIFGKIHFLLLAIFLLVTVCILINQIAYDLYMDFYFEYLSAFDQVIITYENEILTIAIVSFLIWLLRVHSTLRRIAPQYPINEMEYLLRVMLPFVQFWGIASTFIQMSKYFATNPSISKKAIRIKVMVVFVYMFIFGLIPFSLIAGKGWGGTLVTYIILVGYALMYLLYLLTTHWINQYLYVCVQSAPEQALMPTLLTAPVLAPTRTIELTTDMIHSSFVQANIGARLAAKAIEYIIFIFLSIIAIIPGAIHDSGGQMILLISITWLIWFIYLAIHLSINGQTIGKWLLRLKIVRTETGAEGGFIHNVLLRLVANYMIGIFVPFYSLVDILFIFSGKARCIHDRIASTQVIRIQR